MANNLESEPFKCNNIEDYFYLGEDELRFEINDILDNNNTNLDIQCNLVFYNCNSTLNVPFLQFLIFLEKKEKICKFPSFKIKNDDFNQCIHKNNPNEGEEDCEDVINNIIQEKVSHMFNFSQESFKNKINYKGFYNDSSQDKELSTIQLYFFLRCCDDFFEVFEKNEQKNNKEDESFNLFQAFTKVESKEDNKKSNKEETIEERKKNIMKNIDPDTEFIVSIVDEIVFQKKINDIQIDSFTLNLFKNKNFMFLQDKQKNIVDLPILSNNISIITNDEKKSIEFNQDCINEPQTFETPFGNKFIFKKSNEFQENFTKYVIFLGESTILINKNNIILENTDNIKENFSSYENEESIISIDSSKECYYLVGSISSFTKLC